MRIALIDPSLFTLPYDRMLAAGLGRAGQSVTLYARTPDVGEGATDGLTFDPCFYRVAGHPLAASLPGPLRLGIKGVDHWFSMGALQRSLARSRPDVIHFQWLPLPVVDRRFLPGLRAIAPLVLTVHDTQPFNGTPSNRLQRLGTAAGWSGFDRLIVHTGQGRDRVVAQGVPAGRVATLPHGLLDDIPAPVPPDPMQGELTFLLFGKIKHYKGLDILVEAFARLPPALRAQARLRVVGKPYMDLGPIQARAQALGVADRLDLEPRFVDDSEVAAYFAHPGTIAVLPYREIEASGVLGFAVAHRRPVVASRLGSLAETIIEGTHGHLVPPEDIAALAAALAHMIEDRDFAARCSAAMGGLAAAIPGWDDIAAATIATYDAARADWTHDRAAA